MPVVLERVGNRIVVRDEERKRLAELMQKVPPQVWDLIAEINELHARLVHRTGTGSTRKA